METFEARMWLADPDGTRLSTGVLDLVREMDRIALRNERSGVAEEREPWALTADLVAERVPGAERVVLEGAAHLPALERPEEVSALVRRFLDRVEGGS